MDTDEVTQRFRLQLEVAETAWRTRARSSRAQLSARGVNGSPVFKRAVLDFSEICEEMLNQILQEVGNKYDKKSDRDKSLDILIQLLKIEFSSVPKDICEMSQMKVDQYLVAAEQEIASIKSVLEGRIVAFKGGWTSPKPQGWHNRHPIFYAIALLLIGAIFSSLAGPVKELWKAKSGATPISAQPAAQSS